MRMGIFVEYFRHIIKTNHIEKVDDMLQEVKFLFFSDLSQWAILPYLLATHALEEFCSVCLP